MKFKTADDDRGTFVPARAPHSKIVRRLPANRFRGLDRARCNPTTHPAVPNRA